jgi:hypothetical protein
LFNGLVLLGAGHQVPATATVAGHGWAVSEASASAMLSMATIVVLLAWTVRALDPTGNEEAQDAYRRDAIARELRSELRERECLEVLFSLREAGACEFSPFRLGPGITITSGRRDDRTIRDVSPWRLRLLDWHASRSGRRRPVLHVWPGRPVTTSTPLITVAPETRRLGCWWARGCIRTSPIPPDDLAPALAALHAETLDNIRADRPIEARAGLSRLSGLHKTVWRSYAAHGMTYGRDAREAFHLYRQTAGDQLIGLLDEELQAAAISRDVGIRAEAARLPRRLAAQALAEKASLTIGESLGTLPRIYATVVSDLTDDGRQVLPDTGPARARLRDPIYSLLSFTHSDLKRVIEMTEDLGAAPEPTAEAGKVMHSAEFAVSQLHVAHRHLKATVLHAVRLRDSATVRAALEAWKMPDMPLLRDALDESPAPGASVILPHGGGTGQVVTPLRQLGQSLDAVRDGLEAIHLSLLAAALAAEGDAAPSTGTAQAPPGTHSSLPQDADPPGSAPDPIVTAFLDSLPAGRLWAALDTALRSGANEPAWPADDERIVPAGTVTVSGLPDTSSPVLEAFVLAAITRPALASGTGPSGQIALADAPAIGAAIDCALATRLPWLMRYGVSEETVRQRGCELRDLVTAAAQAERHERDEEIRTSPILPAAIREAEAELRPAFHAADITSRLLSWAGILPAAGSRQTASRQNVTINASAPRHYFISGGNPAGIGEWLGPQLAQALLQHVLTTAASQSATRPITPADGTVKVREAIAEVRGNGHPGEPPADAAKVVVIIPDHPYDLRKDLRVTATTADAWTSDGNRLERESLIARLGLADSPALALQVAGLIDDVPVIRTRAITRQIAILNLAKVRNLPPVTSTGEAPGEPRLTLIPPDQALSTGGPPSADGTRQLSPPGAAGEHQPLATSTRPDADPLQVGLRAWVPADIIATEPATARVLTWDEWP